MRIADHHISTFASHTQEVCGLAWSPSGRYLASGSNSNKLVIWDWNSSQQRQVTGVNSSAEPVHIFSQHRAAVKVGQLGLTSTSSWTVKFEKRFVKTF